nr:MAG TPA: hypothetical protein [Bacteriophage sp.]
MNNLGLLYRLKIALMLLKLSLGASIISFFKFL